MREWHNTEGWGVLDSAATPGGCWVHFGALRVPGFRAADPGQTVTFEFEPGPQDGYDFRALSVEIDGIEPVGVQGDGGDPTAFRSELTFGDPPTSRD